MIVVTGATGHLGRGVVEGLLRQLPAGQVGVSVRDPGKAAEWRERGVRVSRGDFAEPESLAEAFDGAEQVLLVSVNRVGDEAIRQHGAAIDAAKQAGVKRILYTSHQAASADSEFAPGRDHAATEAMLRVSAVPFVSLRNGFYAESALYQLSKVRETGVIALPADGPVSWTARADLAEAAVAALLQPALFDGISPPLTGSRVVNFEAVAEMCAEVLGRDVRRETVSDESYVTGLVAHGFPPEMADMLCGLYRASRAGEFDVVDPTLQGVLGREPTSLEQVLRGFLGSAA